MDTGTAAVNAVNAASGFAGQVVLVLLSLISTAAMLWKTTRDQRHQIDLMKAQHEIAAAERREQAAIEHANREVTAAQMRERLAIDNASVQQSLVATGKATTARVEATAADLKADTRVVTQLQTIELRNAIEEAKQFTAARAAEAFKESNDVNMKLKALNEAHQKQSDVLERLVRTLETTAAAAEHKKEAS